MEAITTVGLDIAKSVFQVHGIDAAGKVIIRRQLKRRHVLPFFQRLPACVVGMEACATSHHWSRELRALGHTVRLMPPAYVKPYVKRQKNDAADAEAICEAVTRANMRFVETKAPEQQACLMLHRTRHLFIRQQTSVINAIRAHMAEFGIVARGDKRLGDATVGLPQIESIRTARRVGPDGRIAFDLVAELTQKCTVPRKAGQRGFSYWGGSTVIVDADGRIRYTILKSVAGVGRRERRLDFLEDKRAAQFWQVKNDAYVLKGSVSRLLHASPRKKPS
jgi:hypothetical protein